VNSVEDQHRNFVIITPGRSGSSYLVDTLNNHPDIICKEEVFNRTHFAAGSFNDYLKQNFARRVLAFLFNREKWSHWLVNFPLHYLVKHYLVGLSIEDRQKSSGFKLTLDQLHAYPKVIKVVVSMGFRLIYLTRKDTTRLTLSLIKARRSGNYDRSDGERVSFDPSEVLMVRNQIQRWEHSFLGSNQDILSVQYEDLFDESEDILELIYEEIGADPDRGQRSKMQQVNPTNLEEWVINLEEILKVLES
jgi:LPS sulfotransferase NodH